MLEKIKDLIEVRKIMALVILIVFTVLAFLGKLEMNFVQTIIVSVISWYFGKSTALDTPKKSE